MNIMKKRKIDILCLQETKAHPEDLDDHIRMPSGYHTVWHSAEKKGYSGVALYSRKEPDKIIDKLGWKEADDEGRFLQANFDKLSIISLYLPSGSSGEERQTIKFNFLDRFIPVLKKYGVKKENILSVVIGISYIRKLILKTGKAIRKIQDVCQKNGHGWIIYLIR